MELKEAVGSNSGYAEVSKKHKGTRVTNRDLEILQFVLEMKFASLLDIKRKFFRFSKDGTESFSIWWTYERITQLMKAGYLVGCKKFFSEKVFLISEAGYYFLQNSYYIKNFCKPLYEIDLKTANHDRIVNKVRIDLENYRQVTGWISERAMTEELKLRPILSREFRPDAIYKSVDGKRVAFELENSQKANIRYDVKIQRFVDIMRADESLRLFDLVHFVCSNEIVLKKIKDKTQYYKTKFIVESVDEICPKADL